MIPPNEHEDIQIIANQINVMRKLQFNSHRHCLGGKLCPPGRYNGNAEIVKRNTCKNSGTGKG